MQEKKMFKDTYIDFVVAEATFILLLYFSIDIMFHCFVAK